MDLYVKKLTLKNLISAKHLREFWQIKNRLKNDKYKDTKKAVMDTSFYWINEITAKMMGDVYVLNLELEHKRTTAVQKNELKALFEKTLEKNKDQNIFSENLLYYNSHHCIKIYNPRTEVFFMVFKPISENNNKEVEDYLNIQIFMSKDETPTFKKHFHLSKEDIKFILDTKLFN